MKKEDIVFSIEELINNNISTKNITVDLNKFESKEIVDPESTSKVSEMIFEMLDKQYKEKFKEVFIKYVEDHTLGISGELVFEKYIEDQLST